jgi:hypothetical protein
MQSRRNMLPLAACGLTAVISHASLGDTVKTGPDNVKFDFELNDDPSGRTCNFETLVLVVPDSVKLSACLRIPQKPRCVFLCFQSGDRRYATAKRDAGKPRSGVDHRC